MEKPGPRSRYDAVVFAGGGCRCFWQAGFWSEAAPALGLTPTVVGCVSAGAALACTVFAGATDQVLEHFTRRVAANRRNLYPEKLLRGDAVFPHEEIYRSTILECLGEAGLERLHRGPDIRVAVGRPPGWSGARGGFLLGMAAFLNDQRVRERAHAVWGRRLGFRIEAVSVRQCATPEALADLILHSSCTPPVTPLYRRDGRPVLDGGVVDNVPVELVEPAPRTLVLLTRQVPEEGLPRVAGRTYVQPSQPPPVQRWDYTSPDGVRRTFDLGRADGEAFVRRALRRDAA